MRHDVMADAAIPVKTRHDATRWDATRCDATHDAATPVTTQHDGTQRDAARAKAKGSLYNITHHAKKKMKMRAGGPITTSQTGHHYHANNNVRHSISRYHISRYSRSYIVLRIVCLPAMGVWT